MDVSFDAFPQTEGTDPLAYRKAMDTMKKGDFVFIFTPDDTHYDICKEAITRGMHILVTKPAVKTLKEHIELVRATVSNFRFCSPISSVLNLTLV
jgi:D-galacturonate reductase